MKKNIVIVIDNLRSVENTGSIFRTADGLGVSKIFLIGTTPTPLDRFGRKRSDFAKVSLGAEETMDWEYSKEITPVLEELKSQNFKIMALEQDPRASKLEAINLPAGRQDHKLERLALIVGNEVEGVSKEALDLSDEIVEIGMDGNKESLNVSVATGIALFMLRYIHA